MHDDRLQEDSAHLRVVTRIVVQVDDARRAGVQARLDERVVLDEVVFVEVAADDLVREELPADGQAEHVEAVVVDKVLHLARAVVAVVLEQRRPGGAGGAVAVGVAAEVETGDVYACEFEGAEAGRGCAGGSGGAGGRACAYA